MIRAVRRLISSSFLALGAIAVLLPGSASAVSDLAVDANGKIVVAGTDAGQFATARLDLNGTLDRSFGGDGVIRTHGGLAAAVQPDGRVVVVGQRGRGIPGTDILVVRYLRNGGLDPSFGTRRHPGVVGLDGGEQETGEDVLVKRDGQILVAAIWYCPGWHRGCYYTQSDLNLLRLDRHGRFQHFGDLEAWQVLGLSAAPGGKVLAIATSNEGDWEVAERFNRRTDADQRFGYEGVALLSADRSFGPHDVTAQADGSAVIAMGLGLARLTPRGAGDPSFGTNGLAICPSLDGGTLDRGFGSLSAVAVRPDQRLVAVGARCGLVRFLPEGQVDPSFGFGGSVPVPDLRQRDAQLALQPDGKIVVASWDPGVGSFVVERFLSDGAVDPSFGAAGTAIIPVPRRGSSPV